LTPINATNLNNNSIQLKSHLLNC